MLFPGNLLLRQRLLFTGTILLRRRVLLLTGRTVLPQRYVLPRHGPVLRRYLLYGWPTVLQRFH
jgi:hypothetical protein